MLNASTADAADDLLRAKHDTDAKRRAMDEAKQALRTAEAEYLAAVRRERQAWKALHPDAPALQDR